MIRLLLIKVKTHNATGWQVENTSSANASFIDLFLQIHNFLCLISYFLCVQSILDWATFELSFKKNNWKEQLLLLALQTIIKTGLT